jgi:hypothetical protein
MADLAVIAKVSRPALGGGDLYINTGDYRLAGPQVMSGTVQWDRRTVNSPWVEGDITVSRRRGNTMENLVVYVSGSSQSDLQSNIATLVSAFNQNRYTVQIQIGNANWAWDCEAADYSVQMDTPHINALYVVCTFNIPRKPIALAGGF